MPLTLSWTLVEPVPSSDQAQTSAAQAGLTAVKNFRLDPTSGELDFSGGKLHMVAGLEAIVQSLSCRLQGVLGEWFLDTTIGIPLYDDIVGVKSPDLVAIRALYSEVILVTPGVSGLSSLELSLSTARELDLSFTVGCDFGQLVFTGVASP